jgi:hypothetical protein
MITTAIEATFAEQRVLVVARTPDDEATPRVIAIEAASELTDGAR